MTKFWDSFPEDNARMYALPDGLVYTASYATPFETERAPAVLLLSLADKELTLSSGGVEVSSHAVLVAPKVRRKIRAWGAPFAGVHIDPSHQAFRALMAFTHKKPVQAVDAGLFDDTRENLYACLEGEGETGAAQTAFDTVVGRLSDYLELQSERDPRITEIVAHMTKQSPLDYAFYEILDRVGLSPGRLSHLFTEQVGISLRSFQTWRKVREALALLSSNESLTAIAHLSGFSDSAHFSRTFSKSFGLIPSLFQGDRCVQVVRGQAS